MFLIANVLASHLIVHLWQSRIEIKYYSVVYFECITKFDAL